ncbi:TonB-dependent receptor [Thalassotalea fonticola]|uniref:TonB-dependent receptor n=1 Tax=Thalassotalea fonticola TaxID=3065649 RepID=A0ABZ0GM95_9GAMM|nr:TonB-dependent receptor [Colwelliaceae bacterium S1-1]
MKHINNFRKLTTTTLSISIALALSMGSSQVLAEEQSVEVEDNNNALEVITVTSQKRSQRIQDVPTSINAFTENELKDLGISNAVDIANAIPNIELNSAGGNGNQIITIRGVGLNDFSLNNTPTTAVHIDEVPLSSNAMTGFSLFDLERVEVLKGPQGTLFGRNSTAGVVNFITKKPTDVTEGYVTATVGNYQTFNLEGAFGGELTDSLTARASFKSESSEEGFQTNTNPDASWNENGEVDKFAARVQLLWTGDNTTVLANIHTGSDKSQPWLPQSEGTTGLNGAPCASALVGRPDPSECYIDGFFGASYQGISDTDGDVHSGSYDFQPVADDEYNGFSLRVDHELSFATFTSLTGVDNFHYRHKTDLDGIAGMDLQEIAGFIGLPINDTWQKANILHQYEDFEVDQFTQEFRLTSTTDGDLKWITGLFIATEDMKNTSGYASDNFGLFASLPFDFGGYGAVIENTGAVFNHTFEQENTSYAVFAQFDYALFDKTNISFGTRYTEDEKDFEDEAYGLDDAGNRVVKLMPYSDNGADETTFKQSMDTSHVSWKVGMDHKIEKDWMIYGGISEGHKSGGFPGTIPFAEADVAAYDDETILAYELGSKLSALDNSLRLDITAFYYDYQDMQGVYATAEGFDTLNRVGDAEVKGLELSGTWSLTESLTWSFGAAVLDTEISDSVENVGDALGNPTDFNGKELSHAPKQSASTSFNWTNEVSDSLLLSVQVNAAYKSDFYLRYDNDPSSHWDESSLVLGSRITLSDIDDTWSVALWGRNITDEEIPAYQSFSLAKQDHFVFYNQPSTYGIDFTYRFGD